MSLIADGLLIATCLTAALYCYVLSRRLKQFSNTDDGIGEQIINLNQTLEETRAALKETQASGKRATDSLSREIKQARSSAAQLRNLIEAAEAVPVGNASGARSVGKKTAIAAAPVLPLKEVEPELSVDNDEVAGHDDDEISLDELEVADLPGSPSREQALGFVPDAEVDDEDLSDEERMLADMAFKDDASDSSAPLEDDPSEDLGARAVLDSEQEPDSLEDVTVMTAATPPPQVSDEGLLKVERMAL